MSKVSKLSLIMVIFITFIGPKFSAATLPSVDQGNHYGTSHALFLENFPASNYNFSENTQAVKNILADDTELGYLNYPVNLNHNILTSSDDTLYLYTGDEMFDVNSDKFKSIMSGFSENSQGNIDKLISDLNNEIGQLGTSNGGFNGLSNYNSEDNRADDWLTMGDVGEYVGGLFGSF